MSLYFQTLDDLTSLAPAVTASHLTASRSAKGEAQSCPTVPPLPAAGQQATGKGMIWRPTYSPARRAYDKLGATVLAGARSSQGARMRCYEVTAKLMPHEIESPKRPSLLIAQHAEIARAG